MRDTAMRVQVPDQDVRFVLGVAGVEPRRTKRGVRGRRIGHVRPADVYMRRRDSGRTKQQAPCNSSRRRIYSEKRDGIFRLTPFDWRIRRIFITTTTKSEQFARILGPCYR